MPPAHRPHRFPVSAALAAVAVTLLLALGLAPAFDPVPAARAQEGDPAGAQEPPTEGAQSGDDTPSDVTLVLEPGQRALLRLALPEFEREGRFDADAAAAAEVLESTVTSDLENSRVFQVQGPWAFGRLELTGERSRDFDLYRSLGNEVLVEGRVSVEGERLLFEGRVYDLATKQLILGKRYRGELEVARRVAHTFVDEVILYFTGKRGIGLTSIAFHSDRSGDKEIYLMDFDGADQRRVTGHRSVSLFPAWAPDSSALAYVSYLSGTPGIYEADLTTGRKSPLVTSGRLNTSPGYSADGRRLVFARSLTGNSEIFVADADGDDVRQLTHSRAIDTSPAFSPRGNEIAFTSSRSGRPEIWVMDPEGTNLERISTEGNYNDGAAWSPDGTQLVYASRRNGVFQIVRTDRVTRQTVVLTSGAGDKESPTVSPDGRRIAFTISFAGSGGKESQIWVMDLDGKNLRQLTREGNNYSPAWSPYPPR